MAGEWMLKDDWDSINGLGAENARLQAEVERLEAEVGRLKLALADRTDRHDRDGKALMRHSAECDALRLEVARLTRRRNSLAASLRRAEARIAGLSAEVDAFKFRFLTAVRVLLAFAGRLGVGDDELADLLADAEMREERK